MALRAVMLVAVMLVTVAAVTAAVDEATMRLPVEVQPRRYRIDIAPRLHAAFDFSGQVWIEFSTRGATEPSFAVHVGAGLDADVAGAEVDLLAEGCCREPREGPAVAAVAAERRLAVAAADRIDGDMVSVELDEPLQGERHYRLHVTFNGTLNDFDSGFFKHEFKHGNETKWLAATLFEPAEARWVFPCFDEPALKARFQINVARSPEHVAISNMPLNTTEPMEDGPEGWVWDRFEESPPMSTYLAAWAVGPLASREVVGRKGRRFTVWARPEALPRADYVIHKAPIMHEYLSELLGQEDPVPKTDLLVLSGEHGMENWGLIAFGEEFLPPPQSPSAELLGGSVLAHELAHMWLGNLVTPAWWDAIWLKEGSATYLEALALHHAHPTLGVHEAAAISALLDVSSSDALQSAHPVLYPLDEEEDLESIYDDITYFKGYYLLRMLNHSLGEETLIRGFRRFVGKHRLAAAEERDFWTALTEAAVDTGRGRSLPAGGDVATLMASWTRKAGFPLVTIDRDYATGEVSIRQERFLRVKGQKGADDEEEEEVTKWWVPLSLDWEGGARSTRPYSWLDPDHPNTTLNGTDLPAGDTWLMANVDAAGLYHVNYDARNWALLGAALRRSAAAAPGEGPLSSLSRAVLLHDALELARAGRLPYATALGLTQALVEERALAPWEAGAHHFRFLRRILRCGSDVGAALRRYILSLVSPRFAALGLLPRADEPPSTALTRRLLAKWACALGDPLCVRPALALFARWRSDSRANPLPGDVRAVVLCAAAAHGSRDDWEFLWKRKGCADSDAEFVDVISALGCSRRRSNLARVLKYSISPELLNEFRPLLYQSVADNPLGYTLAKKYLTDMARQIRSVAHDSSQSMLEAVAEGVTTSRDLNDAKLTRLKLHLWRTRGDRALEMAQANVDWTERHRHAVAEWLRANAPPPSAEQEEFDPCVPVPAEGLFASTEPDWEADTTDALQADETTTAGTTLVFREEETATESATPSEDKFVTESSDITTPPATGADVEVNDEASEGPSTVFADLSESSTQPAEAATSAAGTENLVFAFTLDDFVDGAASSLPPNDVDDVSEGPNATPAGVRTATEGAGAVAKEGEASLGGGVASRRGGGVGGRRAAALRRRLAALRRRFLR